MIFNLLANETTCNFKNSDNLKLEKAFSQLALILVAVYMMCFASFISDANPPQSMLFSSGVTAGSGSLGESLGLKALPSNSIFKISNIPTSIKYRIPQRICIDQYGNEYLCP